MTNARRQSHAQNSHAFGCDTARARGTGRCARSATAFSTVGAVPNPEPDTVAHFAAGATAISAGTAEGTAIGTEAGAGSGRAEDSRPGHLLHAAAGRPARIRSHRNGCPQHQQR